MATLIKDISSLVTVNNNGNPYKFGVKMKEVGEIKDGAIIFDEHIKWVGETRKIDDVRGEFKIDKEISLKGKTVLPGFVDSHTHIVFAGDRSAEFGLRLRGATYKEIAEKGGGIQTTVQATRNATIEQLTQNANIIASNAIKYGTTTMEIKSGYSLTTDGELKQLKAIKELDKITPLNLVSTFMGAHDIASEYKEKKFGRDDYIELIIKEMIPRVKEEGLAKFCDVFVDEGYFTTNEGMEILEAGISNDLLPKAHCDELADVGAAKMAAEINAVSADHLLYISDEGIEAIKKSGTVAGLLPGTAYFIKMPYAPARKLIDSGVIVAVATDCNPGSCFTENLQQILSLSVINMGMTAEEAINAATINAAYSLRMSDKVGSLEVGKQADMIVCNTDNYLDILYHFGINHVEQTWIKGNKI